MTFGQRLKESRLQMKLTQKQLAESVGAKHNSVSDWENDKNKPDPDTIELICGVLKITPNYLLNTKTEEFSLLEKSIIKKYRDLDSHGREMVDFTLLKEWERSVSNKEKDNVILMETTNYTTNAAHADDYASAPDELKKQEEDIMDDENF